MRKLGRKADNRKLLIKNLTTSLVIYEHIETTQGKAKELKSSFDKLLNLAKKNTLDSRRKVKAYLTHINAYKKVYEELLPRYKKENSGYTSIYILGTRVGDGAKKVLIKLTKTTDDEKSKKTSPKKESVDNDNKDNKAQDKK